MQMDWTKKYANLNLKRSDMSKYDNYGSFMLAVLDEADKKCNNTIYGSLVRLLGSKGVD